MKGKDPIQACVAAAALSLAVAVVVVVVAAALVTARLPEAILILPWDRVKPTLALTLEGHLDQASLALVGPELVAPVAQDTRSSTLAKPIPKPTMETVGSAVPPLGPVFLERPVLCRQSTSKTVCV